jgi:hypothetical protein
MPLTVLLAPPHALFNLDSEHPHEVDNTHGP